MAMPFPSTEARFDNLPKFDDLDRLSIGEIADMPPALLLALQDEAAAETARVKRLKDRFEAALAQRYSAATEAERRQRLKAVMFRRSELPTYDMLEEKLQDAGFDVQVHANSPAVDPNTFLAQNFNMTCGDLLPGGNDAQCGEPEAYCAQVGGELLVNGEIFWQLPNYTCLCGEALALCGEAGASCGEYDGVTMFPLLYDVPAEAGYWPLIFFVGGEATRDPVTGELTSIDIAPVAIERRLEFRRIILRYKPMAAWAGLVVVYG